MITNSLFQTFDTTNSIHEAFSSEYASVLVALNPFNKKIFADKYNPIDRLELTYPLLEPVSWGQVASDIGFKSIKILANALTDYKSSVYRELNDYSDDKELEWPAVNDEVIPVEIIIPVLKAAIIHGAREVVKSYTQDTSFEDQKTEQKFEVSADNLFEVAKTLHYSQLIIMPEVGVSVLRPMRDDCPYTVILSQKDDLILKEINLVGFKADDSTKFCWWK